MKGPSKTPDFHQFQGDLVNAIPPEPQNTERLDSVVTDYLNHYRLNLYAEGLAKRHEIWQSNIKQGRIVEQRWLPIQTRNNSKSTETLYLVHGYFDHSALYGKLIRWGLRSGFEVHSFDLPGHGLSGGKPAAIDSFDRYSEVLATIIEREAKTTYHLIGQSTGCAVIINALLNSDLSPKITHPPDQIILLAPLVRSMHWQRVRWLYFLLRPVLNSIKRHFVDSSHDISFNQFLKHRDPLQAQKIPLVWLGAMDAWTQKIQRLSDRGNLSPLIIQGTEDSTVDWRFNLAAIKRCMPHTEIKFVDGARHHLSNESSELWSVIIKALEQRFRLEC